MTAAIPPYPAYRDSGVPWLGAVPQHWEVLPDRAVFVELNERGHADEEMLSVTITKGVVEQRLLLKDTSRKDGSNRDKSAYKLVCPGDIVYNKMRAWQGAIGMSDLQGIVSPAYIVQRPRKDVSARYFHYLFRTPGFAKEAERWSYGIVSDMWSLRAEHFRLIQACLPPLPEQHAIVRYLDHMDRLIRRYIRAKQMLLTLLNEQKQAIIHQAVTRGLDPNVRLKPSGVEWLGDVPEHWDVRFLGRCLRRIDQGWSPVAAEGEMATDQWAVLTLSSVKHGVFNAAALKPVPISSKIREGIEIQDGDLLLTRSNTRQLVGDVCIVQGARPKTLISDLIYRLNLEPTLFDATFLMFQLLGPLGRGQIERDARGSSDTMPKISQRYIRSWRVVAPPLAEQLDIVASIGVATNTIDDALRRASREIFLLREYRTRLIADVVTGKLDVRQAAAALPEEVDALDELEGTEPPDSNADLEDVEGAMSFEEYDE